MTQRTGLTTADAGTGGSAEQATKIYGLGETGVRALDDVGMAIPGAELTAIMGPSGSGKSTLLHCMAGLDSLTRGQVFLGDRDLARLSDRELTLVRRDRIGFVFQAFNLVSGAERARQHLGCRFTLGGRGPGPSCGSEEVVATVRTGRPPPPSPRQLSGGEQQRVAVARALVARLRRRVRRRTNRKLGLAGRAARCWACYAGRWISSARRVVMVTHDPVAAAYANSVAFLSDGRLVEAMRNPTAQRVVDLLAGLGN